MPVDRLTLKQDRFVTAIVSGKAKSQTHAALIAGYGPAGASVEGSRTLGIAKIQRAIERRKRGKRDTVSAILDSAIVSTSDHLSRQHDPMFALAAMKTSADVLEKLPEDAPPAATGLDLDVYGALCVLAGWRMASAGIAPGAALRILERHGIGPGDHPMHAQRDVTAPVMEISQDLEIGPSQALDTRDDSGYAAAGEEGEVVEEGEKP